MPAIEQLTSVWRNLKEFELEPIRKEALRPLRVALVGADGSGRRRLAEQMLRDPSRSEPNPSAPAASYSAAPHVEVLVQTPLLIVTPDAPALADEADLILLLLDADSLDFSVEQRLARAWGGAGKKVLVFCNSPDAAHGQELLHAWAPWNASAALVGWVEDIQSLLAEFVPVVLKLLPDKHLALGRQFPLFRIPIARQLISDTCFANAAYALGSGLAEVVPALNLPLNITDMVVLTKAQGFLVYRLGLLLGFSTHWQDYLAEFGSVIGGGFLWRQLARSLVGLIPVWGIVPKIAVAYAGTQVVGNTVLQWYLTGRHLNPRQVRDLYRQALAQGKQNAKRLLQRAPRPRLPRLPLLKRKTPAILPGPPEITLPETAAQPCPDCGQLSAPDARFCQYCGREFVPPQAA